MPEINSDELMRRLTEAVNVASSNVEPTPVETITKRREGGYNGVGKWVETHLIRFVSRLENDVFQAAAIEFRNGTATLLFKDLHYSCQTEEQLREMLLKHCNVII